MFEGRNSRLYDFISRRLLRGVYRRIADANVNVNLTYVATNNRLVVGADNIQKVKEALTKEAAPAAARR